MQNFDINLAEFLSHSIVHFNKNELSPNGIVDDARCNEDPHAPTASDSMGATLGAVNHFLPQYAKTVAGISPTLDNASIASSARTSPAMQAIQAALFQAFGPQLAATQNTVNAGANSANAQNTSNIINGGTGAAITSGALDLAKMADPQYYKQRQVVTDATNKLLGAQDPTKLSGAEQANTERAINRTNIGSGNANTPSATTTASGAMTFGNELAKKQDRFGQALSLANGTLPNIKSGVNTFTQATGGSTNTNNNAAQSMFTGVQNSGQDAQNFGNNFMGTTAGFTSQANDTNANRRDLWDRTAQAFNSI